MRAPILVWVLAAAFLLLVASLLIGSFTKPEFPPYALGAHADSTYTLDASRGDEWRWWGGWGGWGGGDLGFRRNHIITAPGAGAIDLGPVPFDSVAELPASGYVPTSFAADTANAAIGKWYDYSMWSHLLTSRRHVYAIRTRSGEFAKLEILAYYCREVGAACYTIRLKAMRPRLEASGARN
ncbi:MAG TPA: HmuY family protein [Gemmatimonadales bacterium]|nr:HmuY family protein [Gemmatimonadales bacterium]